MLGELSWEDEPDSSLNLAGGDSRLLVVAGQAGGLGGDLLEDVIDERVQDRHSLAGDTSVRVHLQVDPNQHTSWWTVQAVQEACRLGSPA